MTKHGKSKTVEYHAWKSMRRRCYDPLSKKYSGYGGRGIEVCESWRTSFTTFLKDMGLRPTKKHSLDRIDNDGPYSPENCRWAIQRTQQNNRRDNRRIEAMGLNLTMSQWSRHLGVPVKRIQNRIYSGWDPAKALTVPLIRQS